MRSKTWWSFQSRLAVILLITPPVIWLGLSPAMAAVTVDEVHWTIMGQTAVAFDWRASEASTLARTIEWGTAPGVYTDSTLAITPNPLPTSSAGPFYEAVLAGLAEDTVYYYRIAEGSEHTFRTPPPLGSSDFWIGIIASSGSHLNYPMSVPTFEMLSQDNGAYPGLPGTDALRFVINNGDLTYGDAHGHEKVDAHFNDVMVWSRDIAYMPAWGNHDHRVEPICDPGADTPIGCAPGNLNEYEGRFALPNDQTSPNAPVAGGPGEDWYWFDYGNTRFIAAPEPYVGALYTWKADVAPIMAEAQADPAMRFIVTFAHRRTWSSGADHPDDGTNSLSEIVRDLHADYDKLVLHLSAHAHSSEITDPAQTDGVVHLRQSGGGATCGGLEPIQPPWSVFRLDHLSHTRLHFTGTSIEGYIICGPDGAGETDSCVTGEVVHSFVIDDPNPVACETPDQAIDILQATMKTGGDFVLHFADPNPSHAVTGYNVYRVPDAATDDASWPMIDANVGDMDSTMPDIQWISSSGDISPTGFWFYQITAYNENCSPGFNEGPF